MYVLETTIYDRTSYEIIVPPRDAILDRDIYIYVNVYIYIYECV